MLKSSSQIAALLLCALLAACQGGPQPAPQPAAKAEPPLAVNSADDTLNSAPDPEADAATAQPPPAPPAPVDVDQIAYQQAIEALQSGETEAALILLTQLSEDAPGKPRLFTNLGLAQFRLQRFELAEDAFRQAIKRDADDAIAHNHLGILERRKGQFENALREYQRAIEIDPNYASAQLNLGILFDLYLQDLEKALQQYRKYQTLTSAENEQVAGWIIDIERRLKTDTKPPQG